MKNRIFTHLSLLLLYLLAVINSHSQTVIWNEDFQNGCAAACPGVGYTSINGTWTQTITGTEGSDPNLFFVSCAENNTGAGNCSSSCAGNQTLHLSAAIGNLFCPNDCGAAYDAGGLCGLLSCPMTNKRIESPIIDLSTRTNVSINFVYLEGGQGTTDDATLWYNDGSTWSVLDNMPKTPVPGSCFGQGQWTARTVALPASANNNSNVRIAFRWVNNDDGAGVDPSFAVDDIELTIPTGGGSTPPITTILSTTDIDCFGDNTGVAHATTNSGQPNYSYQWYSGTIPSGVLIPGPAGTDSILSGVTAGDYYVIVTDGNSLMDTAIVTLTEPSSSLSADTSSVTDALCFGQSNGSVILSGNGGTSPYEYSLDGVTYVTTALFSNLSPASYTGYVRDDNGCIDTINFTIGQPSSAVAIDTTNHIDASCVGVSNGEITFIGSGGTGPYTFSIDGTNFLSSTNFPNLVANSYTGTVEDANGCTQTINFTIGNQYAVNFNIIEQDFSICEGDLATFNYIQTNGVGTIVFNWTNASSLLMDEPNNSVEVSPTTNTTYEGYIVDANGCTSNTESITISIDNGVDLNLSDTLVEINNGDIIEIDAGVDVDGTTFIWTPEDGLDNPNAEIVNASPNKKTVYIVEATTENGCSTEGKVTVIVRAELEIVTAFSPNGDGVNETWEIRGIENFPDASVKIFNRWGNMLYNISSEYELNEWTGDDAPAASYFYIINLGDGSAELNGTVTIIK